LFGNLKSRNFEEVTGELMKMFCDMVSQKRESKEIAEGLKPEIYHDFIKTVCSKIS
jgi:hypothetical protein